ncbi:hypothetical protein [Carboxylicivirga taeanensis]|uniref:hypothetical protein n=1 Tax=Carboxylicivirga taeanensis TaxID=1416875 RepID=UPI003F6DEEEE
MKRLYIPAAIAFFLMSVMSEPVSAQGNSRHSKGHKGNKKWKASKEHRHEVVRERDSRTYYHDDYGHKTSHYHAKNHRKYDREHYHRHNQHHEHRRHYPVYKHSEVRYLSCLPSRHYTRVYFGDEAYYYCDGHFYAYHSGCGYQLVDIHFQTVSHLPRHCDVRVVDGRRFYYKDGHCYLPHADGHYRVFNISLSF